MTGGDQDKLVLIGGGGHALVVAEAARTAGRTIVGYLDDDEQTDLAKLAGVGAWLGRLEAVLPRESPAILALGDIRVRRRLIDAYSNARWCNVLHPRAIIAGSAKIEMGTLVCAGAIVQTMASVGAHGLLNTGCIVEHECAMGSNVHVGPGVVLCGRVVVGDDTLIGAGAVVLPNVKIGSQCVIGAGAVVREDVADGATVVGVPARAVDPVACARG